MLLLLLLLLFLLLLAVLRISRGRCSRSRREALDRSQYGVVRAQWYLWPVAGSARIAQVALHCFRRR